MKPPSQRRAFVALMTLLATLSGTGYGVYELWDHSDRFADLLKLGGLLAIASLCVSYGVWTLTHLKKDSVRRGGLAGLITGLALVTVPYGTSTLKAEFLRLSNSENKGIVMSFLEALPLAIQSGAETFQIISKVSLVAVIASVILGVIIAKRIAPRAEKVS